MAAFAAARTRAVAFGLADVFCLAAVADVAGALCVRFRAAFDAVGSGAAVGTSSALACDCATARNRLTRGAAVVTGGGVSSGEGEGAD